RHHMLRLAEHVRRMRHATRRERATQRAKFIRISENIDKIWRFEPFDCSASVRGRTRMRGSCARKSGRKAPLSIPSDLCKIFSPRGLARAARTAESGSNRPNRLRVIRARQRTADRRRRTEIREWTPQTKINEWKNFAAARCVVGRRLSVR